MEGRQVAKRFALRAVKGCKLKNNLQPSNARRANNYKYKTL